jgi:hypothetical protein
MAQITEDCVSFETAKLLKEKGFDGKCARVWVEEKGNEPIRMGMSSFVEGEEVADNETVEAATGYANEYMFKNPCVAYLCPTLQMAMKWLREEHNLHIDVFPYCEKKRVRYQVLIWTLPPKRTFRNLDDIYDCEYKSNEQACDAAIKWCLEKIV